MFAINFCHSLLYRITVRFLNCRIILLVVLWCMTGVQVNAQASDTRQQDIEVLIKRLVQQYIAENTDVQAIANSLQAGGYWPDINYRDTVQADFNRHTRRLKHLAIAYQAPSNGLYHSESLLRKMQAAFEFFYTKKWKAANWWYGEIGVPTDYMVALLLLRGSIKNEALLRYASFLKDVTDNQSHQGMNRVWVSRIAIVKGCIEDNYELVKKGFLSAASTLAVAATQGSEGIKNDMSFHQHRAQLYSGGYGVGFANDMADLQWLSIGTSFASLFTTAQRELFAGLLLQGHQLLGYHNTMDFGAIGRNISRPGGGQAVTAEVPEKMMDVTPAHATAFAQWRDHLKGAVFPEAFRGNRYFWRSAVMTQHGAGWYLSAKVISTRTTGTEMLNEENLLGYNLPLGATNVMVTGEEYKGIYPVWDWSRIPGVTAVNNNAANKLSWYLFGNNELAGGVSNGKQGVLAYAHSYNGVQAKKAYFFMNDYLVCMGAGISAMRTQEITTSIDQSLANGIVQYGYAGNAPHTLTAERTEAFDTSAALWVYHNKTGYLLPQGGRGKLQQRLQTGSWRAINASESAAPVSRNVFSMWLQHGLQPSGDSYVYQVVPGISLNAFQQMAVKPDFTVVQNTDTLQAIRTSTLHAAVFYQKGRVNWGNGWQLEADGPAAVLLTIHGKQGRITVGDPLYRRRQITVTIYKPDEQLLTFTIDLPQGAMQGSSTGVDFTF